MSQAVKHLPVLIQTINQIKRKNTMAHILVHHKVEDYKKRKLAFDEHGTYRSKNGSKEEKYSAVQVILMKFSFCSNEIVIENA